MKKLLRLVEIELETSQGLRPPLPTSLPCRVAILRSVAFLDLASASATPSLPGSIGMGQPARQWLYFATRDG